MLGSVSGSDSHLVTASRSYVMHVAATNTVGPRIHSLVIGQNSSGRIRGSDDPLPKSEWPSSLDRQCGVGLIARRGSYIDIIGFIQSTYAR